MKDKIPIQRAGVKWIKLNPTNAVKEQTTASNTRAPIVPEEERTQSLKYDFEETFDRPSFITTVEVPVLDQFRR